MQKNKIISAVVEKCKVEETSIETKWIMCVIKRYNHKNVIIMKKFYEEWHEWYYSTAVLAIGIRRIEACC